MKPLKGQQSLKCISAVVLLETAFARKMDNKDDETEEPEKLEKQQKSKPKSEEQPRQNLEAHSTVSHPAQLPQNADSSITGERPHSSRGILLDGAHRLSNSEEPINTSNSRSRESRPRILIKDLSDIPLEDLGESLVSSPKTASRSSKSSMSSRPLSSSWAESIEGEFELGQQENMGPTLGQYRYQMTREDYDKLSKSLQEKTIATLVHLGEIHKAAYVDSQSPTMKAPVAPRLSQETTEAQLFVLEKEMKLILRRINESKREQAYTLQRINDLEVKMFKKQGAEYLREIMSKVPNEEDLKDMEQIRQLMLERKRLKKEIEKLNMEMSSMNKAMANADVIISDCAAIKKPRKVVICTGLPSLPLAQEDSASREAIGRGGESPSRGHLGSPPTTDSIDSPLTSGASIVEPDVPEEPNVPTEPEQSNAPETTESNDVRSNGVGKEDGSNGK